MHRFNIGPQDTTLLLRCSWSVSFGLLRLIYRDKRLASVDIK